MKIPEFLIPLSGGKIYAIISAEDYEYLNRWKWTVTDDGYARRELRKMDAGFVKGRRTSRYMVREIFMRRGIDIPQGMSVDHINRIRHDNRFENLRLATNSQQKLNIGPNRGGSTSYKGVCRHSEGWYMARFKGKYLGIFHTPEEAAMAYDSRLLEECRRFPDSVSFIRFNFPGA